MGRKNREAVLWGQPIAPVRSVILSPPLGKGTEDGDVEKEGISMLEFTTLSAGFVLKTFLMLSTDELPFSVQFSFLLMDSQLAGENQRDTLTLLGPDFHSQTEHEE